MLTVLAGLAEFERELIRSRTGEGREREQIAVEGLPRRIGDHQRRSEPGTGGDADHRHGLHPGDRREQGLDPARHEAPPGGEVAAVDADLDRVLEMFPRLGERRGQRGGTMSGGEQQMLAMARALMSRPRFLCMDEPSMGLAPVLVEQQFETIQRLNATGITIFVVEQNATMALGIADRGYVLQSGRVVLADTAQRLLENPQMQRAYLGM